MIRGSSISRFLNNREIKDPQTNRYICRLYGFTRSKCWLWGTFVTHSFLPSVGRLDLNQCGFQNPRLSGFSNMRPYLNSE